MLSGPLGATLVRRRSNVIQQRVQNLVRIQLNEGQLFFDGFVDLQQAECIQSSVPKLFLPQWALGPIRELVRFVQFLTQTQLDQVGEILIQGFL